MIVFIICLLAAYLIGSIPTSYLVGKLARGIDLREHGSGNLGATNAFRVLGWKIGVFVLICDVLKGAVPVLVFSGIAAEKGGFGLAKHNNIGLVIGLAAIMGHMFTIFMKFKGGKGVAASMGVFLALAPIPFLITFAVSALIIGVTRYVSAGSIIGSILLPVLVYIFYPDRVFFIIFTIIVGILVIVRHRSNIVRLLKGRENKLFP